MEGKYLITTDDWFTAPDGKDYKAAWGNVEVLTDSILGVKTNAKSTNWFAKVGSDTQHVIIAGCQIHYAIKSEDRPVDSHGETWEPYNGELKRYQSPTKIYIAE